MRLGTRTFQAQAKQIYPNRPVFLVHTPHIPRVFTRLLWWTPRAVKDALQRWFPEWFLPAMVILKEEKEHNDGRHLLEHEIRMFEQLRSLQGRCIPWCFGCGQSINKQQVKPALVLQYIPGPSLLQVPAEQLLNPCIASSKLCNLAPEDFIHPDLLRELRHTYDELTAKNIVHGDPELHNFIWTGQEIVAIDFEFAEYLRSDSQNQVTNEHEFESMVDAINARIFMAHPELKLAAKVTTSCEGWIRPTQPRL